MDEVKAEADLTVKFQWLLTFSCNVFINEDGQRRPQGQAMVNSYVSTSQPFLPPSILQDGINHGIRELGLPENSEVADICVVAVSTLGAAPNEVFFGNTANEG